jgi:hypothetical protein
MGRYRVLRIPVPVPYFTMRFVEIFYFQEKLKLSQEVIKMPNHLSFKGQIQAQHSMLTRTLNFSERFFELRTNFGANFAKGYTKFTPNYETIKSKNTGIKSFSGPQQCCGAGADGAVTFCWSRSRTLLAWLRLRVCKFQCCGSGSGSGS